MSCLVIITRPDVWPFPYRKVSVRFQSSTITTEARTGAITWRGSRDGDEVIQIYVKDVVSSHAKPVMELKAFKRINLKAGETKEVELSIDKKELELYQGDGQWQLEPGEFVIMAGGSSKNLPLKESITL